MNRTSGLVAVLLLALAPALDAAAQNLRRLTAEDLVEIRWLMDAYAQILDHCIGAGEDYANLFTEDGTFGVSSEWGGAAKIWFRGRAELARVGGGGPGGCLSEISPTPSYHLNINPLITATPGGAKARSTLLTITNDTDARGDVMHYEGGYEDTFEKTPDGWRFRSRVHVWPEIEWTDRPEDMPPRNLAEE
jgi:hypothetical protein